MCLYSLDQLHLGLDYTPQYMDLSTIFDLPNLITTPSDEDIPNLEDVLQLKIQTVVCIDKLVTQKDGIMNTDRNCATLLTNCEIKEH